MKFINTGYELRKFRRDIKGLEETLGILEELLRDVVKRILIVTIHA
ncbi:MAG: hypothetical protein QXT53_06295 [Ignisphaera sp.]